MSRSDEDVEVRGWLEGETPKALCVAKELKPGSRSYWFPRSLIRYLQRNPHPDGTQLVMKVPEWKVKSIGCWELVE